MDNLLDICLDWRDKKNDHFRLANTAANYMTKARMAQTVGDKDLIYDFSIEAAENFFLSAECLESINNYARAMFFFQFSAEGFLMASSVSEGDMFWDATFGYREALDGYNRSEDRVVYKEPNIAIFDGWVDEEEIERGED
jgi:hypothetical protein